MDKKVVHVFSGGLDSTCLLASLLDEGCEVKTISFIYGAKHNFREILAAKSICRHYGIKDDNYIYMPFISHLFKSDLLKSGEEIPNGHYTEESMKKTVVPFRNGIFVSIAAGYAESIEYSFVSMATHAGDHTIYPDCRPAFLETMERAIYFGTDGEVILDVPYMNLFKYEILAQGCKLKAPIEKTWSCYKGEEIHCGTCGTCVERKEAFKQAEIPDPTEYKS